MKSNQSISLVIPCYNEDARLAKSFGIIKSFLKSTFADYELILVNDGSYDGTLDLMKSLKSENDFIKIVSYSENQGKGFALRQGVAESTKDLILISDSDLSTPLEDFHLLYQKMPENKIVIGSRAMLSSEIAKKQAFYKVLLGKLGNKMIKLFLGLTFKDTQCGFKLFDKSVKKLFAKSEINGFGYDFEILYLAKKEKFKTTEVGVHWSNDDASKVRMIHYFLTFWELLKIRFIYSFLR